MIWDTIETAADALSPLTATADACLALGMKYCLGHGVAPSNIEAHKWFNLAAMKGVVEAREKRAEISIELGAEGIAEAQRQARAWLASLH